MPGLDGREPLTVYQQIFLDQLPRAMALQDFNPRSRTYGCCDRDYWQYKTLASFPSSVYQQLAIPFATAFVNNAFANPYFQDEQLLDRAIAAVKSWGQFQHRTGAVDEWYRHEFSYCPTAFTAYGMAETLLLLRDSMQVADFEACLASVLKSCDWLSKRFNPQVMNQNLAACGALWSAFQLTDDQKWERAFVEKWDRTLAHLHPEGWFLEYDGGDLGYTTLALDVLAGLHRRGCEQGVLDTAQSVCEFMQPFATSDGHLAGRLGSRGTEHTFPFGIHYFAEHFQSAQHLAGCLRPGHAAGRSLTPQSVDDRYFAYFYLPQFSQAATVSVQQPAEVPASDGSTTSLESGFQIQRRGVTTLIASVRRQGALNLSAPGQPVHHNFGFWAETTEGARYASCGWNASTLDMETSATQATTIRGQFSKVADKLPLAKGAVPFTLLSEWLLRWEPLAERFQKLIKQRKIVQKKTAPLDFQRRICWRENALILIDEIRKQADCPQITAVGPVDDVDVHSPSAKFSTSSSRVTIDQQTAAAWAEQLNQNGILKLRTTYVADAGGALVLQSCEIENASTPLTVKNAA